MEHEPMHESEYLKVRDDTGKQWTIPTSLLEKLESLDRNKELLIFDPETLESEKAKVILNEAIDAKIFSKFKRQFRIYDPFYQNTAIIRSQISFVDGKNGILQYRGYDIESLAEKSSYLEVAFLLIYGYLPSLKEMKEWRSKVMKHTFVHTKMNEILSSFNYDAHPMGMFISSMAAMSTFYPESNPSLQGPELYIQNEYLINKQIFRIIGKTATLAAATYRHRLGRLFNMPQNQLDYVENFLYMMDRLSEGEFRPHPVLVRALNIMFILHAEHEMNCSTAAMRHIASARTDPYSAIAGASSALYGPLHGGANEAVLVMLEEIGSVDNVEKFIQDVKDKKKLLFGFGHRIYRTYDPRAKIIQKVAYEVFDLLGTEPLINIARSLESIALKDDYFKKRNLYPNVDFYSGLIYKAMGFPTDFFPLLFAVPRVAGWMAHWREEMQSSTLKIWRPKQIYEGPKNLKYEVIEKRKIDDSNKKQDILACSSHPFNKRYIISSKL